MSIMRIWKVRTQKTRWDGEVEVYLESSEGTSVYMDTMPAEEVEENERIAEILADLNAGKWVGIPESGDLFCVIPPDGGETYSAETIADLVTELTREKARLEAIAEAARELAISVVSIYSALPRPPAVGDEAHALWGAADEKALLLLDALDGAEKEADNE